MKVTACRVAREPSSLVKTEVYSFRTAPRACPYVPSEISCLDYRVILALPPEQYEEMLSRGWRRNGWFFFRPACSACSRCISLRVRVQDFTLSQSQKRSLRKNDNVRLVIQPPSVTAQHVALWNSYHAHMRQVRGWPSTCISEREYAESFVLGNFSFRREFLYYEGSRLVAVGLVDVTPNALSSIYFFHDPALRHRALGVFSLVQEIQFAQEHRIKHAYLGYWVAECQSLAYKTNYRPYELLVGLPDDQTAPLWKTKEPEG